MYKLPPSMLELGASRNGGAPRTAMRRVSDTNISFPANATATATAMAAAQRAAVGGSGGSAKGLRRASENNVSLTVMPEEEAL